MTVPEKVAELVERFEEQRDDYRSARYNETLLRRDFLDPFFTALGWDVDNHATNPNSNSQFPIPTNSQFRGHEPIMGV